MLGSALSGLDLISLYGSIPRISSVFPSILSVSPLGLFICTTSFPLSFLLPWLYRTLDEDFLLSTVYITRSSSSLTTQSQFPKTPYLYTGLWRACIYYTDI